MEELDVTTIAPPRKHPAIFEKFESLGKGESFIIHNDHDPKPLYYQMLAELGPVFGWEYIQQGPDDWKVRISRPEDPEKDLTIGEITAKDYRKAEVFKKYGLDFCCGGNKTVEDASREKGLDEAAIKKDLAAVENQEQPLHDFNTWRLDILADYIVNQHHAYVRNAIPTLYEFTQKIAKVHGSNHPELNTIAGKFVELSNELLNHLEKEEKILFPYIRALQNKADNPDAELEEPPFGSVDHPVQMMRQEHDDAGALLETIKQASNNYTLPDDACNTYQVTFKKLQEFEADLHQHIHLENNILFPKARELEKKFL